MFFLFAARLRTAKLSSGSPKSRVRGAPASEESDRPGRKRRRVPGLTRFPPSPSNLSLPPFCSLFSQYCLLVCWLPSPPRRLFPVSYQRHLGENSRYFSPRTPHSKPVCTDFAARPSDRRLMETLQPTASYRWIERKETHGSQSQEPPY